MVDEAQVNPPVENQNASTDEKETRESSTPTEAGTSSRGRVRTSVQYFTFQQEQSETPDDFTPPKGKGTLLKDMEHVAEKVSKTLLVLYAFCVCSLQKLLIKSDRICSRFPKWAKKMPRR